MTAKLKNFTVFAVRSGGALRVAAVVPGTHQTGDTWGISRYADHARAVSAAEAELLVVEQQEGVCCDMCYLPLSGTVDEHLIDARQIRHNIRKGAWGIDWNGNYLCGECATKQGGAYV